ncbi:hypothetical protein FQR65_LT02019 [Abscondita terminalis]|nr:hypothetical protein FQR65_LT02019 [Abscondita terminalis]
MLKFNINKNLLPMKGYYFFWNAGTAPIVPFMSVYAKQLGFSSTTVGIIYTILPFSGMLAKPLMGTIADKFRCGKLVFLLAQLVATISFFSMIFLPELPPSIRQTHLACDNYEATIDFCLGDQDKYALNKIQSITTDKIMCQMSCDLEKELSDIVCKNWYPSGTCAGPLNKINFTAHTSINHTEQFSHCLYFRVVNVTLQTGVIVYPECPLHQKISTLCSMRCNSDVINKMLEVQYHNVRDYYQFWLLLCSYLISWLGQAVTVSVADTLCFQLLGGEPHKYGYQRMMGALGWGLLSSTSGVLVDVISTGEKKNYGPVFGMGVSLLIVCVIVSSQIQYSQQEISSSILKDMSQLLCNVRIIVYAYWCICMGMCTGLMWNFQFWLLEELAENHSWEMKSWIKTIEGLSMGIQSLGGELPFFFLSSWILKRIGHVHTMSLVLLVVGVRFMYYSLLTNPWWTLPIEFSNGLTFGLFYATMASYASIVSPPGTETTTQGLVGAAFEGIGVSSGSLIAGLLIDANGGSKTFRMFGIFALAAFLVHALIQFMIQRSDKYGKVIENFLTEEEIQLLKGEAANLIENMPESSNRTVFSTKDQTHRNRYFLDSSDKISYFFEEGAVGPDGELLVEPNASLNKIGHALHDKNKIFRKITFDERVKETCFQFKMADPVILQSMYIFKNPQIGGEVSPHQDGTFLYTDPMNLIGFWIALDDATLENGCLWFARASHKGGVHRRFMRNPDPEATELLIFDTAPPHYQKSNFTSVPVKKGTCILIHGQVVHYSDSNKSSKPRNAYTFHVMDQKNTKYSKDNWLQLPNSSFLSLYKN